MTKPCEGTGVYDNFVGKHRVSLVTKDGAIEWVVIDDAHFTIEEFNELTNKVYDFQEEESDNGS